MAFFSRPFSLYTQDANGTKADFKAFFLFDRINRIRADESQNHIFLSLCLIILSIQDSFSTIQIQDSANLTKELIDIFETIYNLTANYLFIYFFVIMSQKVSEP